MIDSDLDWATQAPDKNQELVMQINQTTTSCAERILNRMKEVIRARFVQDSFRLIATS